MIKKNIFKRCLAGALSFAMAVTLYPANALGTAKAADDAPTPALHYDMSHADGKLTDVSGNSHHGTLKNFADADFSAGNEGNMLNFDGSEKYVEIPSGVIKGEGKESFTLEATYMNNTQSAAWLLTLGTTVGEYPKVNNYLFVAPSTGDYSGKMMGAIKDGEKELRSDKETAIAGENEGKNIVTVVFDKGNVTYYLNGLKAKTTESGYKIQDMLNANSTDACIGYIGKSLYKPDPYFKGALLDFKVYESALTEEQVAGSHQEIASALEAPAAAKVNEVKDKILPLMLNGNADKDHVVSDLSFPAELEGVVLNWTSSDASVVDAKGKVTPKDAETAVTVTVEASYNRRGTQTETYQVKVLGKSEVEYESLRIPNMVDIRGNITLPSVGKGGSAITWTSDNEAVISAAPQGDKPAGVVTRQDTDTKVKLTATIKETAGDRTKEFDVTVKKKAEVDAMTDYVFAYFAGDGAGEQIFLAASRDGMHWEELNDGEPVLKSEMGTTGLRDPYILRSPEGDKFYLVATDLSIALANWNWDGVQKEGSQALMVWESDDLINWTNQRMAVVSAQIEAGCTWAPEVFYDDTTGEYMLFWSSKVKEDNYGKQRVYYCKTRDFYTFTEPKIWIENSFSTIDTTVIKGEDNRYYRFSKNEAGDAKYIYEEVADTLLGEWEGVGWTKSETGINSVYPKKIGGGEGPCCFRINDDDREKVGANYCLLIDDFGGVRYYPMLTDDLASGEFTDAKAKANLPKKPCHGTVMNITEAEYKALTTKWGTPSLAAGSLPTVVETGYTLPAEADVVFAGETKKVAVTWDKTADDFKAPGTVTVKGTFTVDGKTGTSEKTIEVISVSEDLIYYIDSGVGNWNSNLSKSAYYELVGKKADLRNALPDQIYTEGSWGIVNPEDSSKEGYANAGNRTSAENSIYANGWWAKDGKSCEYIIPLENGTYEAAGYFAEWWGTSRPIKFYAQYTDDSGKIVKSEETSITLSGSDAKQTATAAFTVAGVADKAEVHFYAENAEGKAAPAPVIAGLAVEWKGTADEKAQLEANKEAAKASLENVTVSPAGDSVAELHIGDTQDMKVTYPEDLAEKAKAAKLQVVTSFESSSPQVASVSQEGKITAVAAGEAEITTTVSLSSKISKTFVTKVTVKEAEAFVPVSSVNLSPDKKALTLAVGKKASFKAVVAPSDATEQKVTWETSAPKVVFISQPDKAGKVTVTAKKAGTAKITAKAGGKTAACTVTVVSLNQTKLTLGKGEEFSLKVNGAKKNVSWNSSNKKAVSVKKGKVKALKTGKKAVNITAKVDGVTLTCKVTVKAAPKKITLNAKKKDLEKGKTFQIKVKLPKNTASSKITYKNSNKKIVSVDAKGKVKALKKGKATITVVTFNNKKASVTFNVK